MTREGEAWPTSTDREAELAGSRGKKALQAKGTEEERREGGKEADDWNREGRVLTSSRPVVNVCYIIICLSGLNVKLGYWRKKKYDNHKQDIHRNKTSSVCSIARTRSEAVRIQGSAHHRAIPRDKCWLVTSTFGSQWREFVDGDIKERMKHDLTESCCPQADSRVFTGPTQAVHH